MMEKRNVVEKGRTPKDEYEGNEKSGEFVKDAASRFRAEVRERVKELLDVLDDEDEEGDADASG